MVPGFNTDFKYRGDTYHVQTEDNGVANPVVVTLLYHKGAILASRRTPYNDLVGKPKFEQELMGLMKAQHKELMRSLLAGELDREGAAPAIAGGSGEHPAVAAAAAAACSTPPKAKPQPERPRIPAVRAATVAAAAPAAAAGPLATTAPRAATPTLDAAIRRYLEEFAATAATAVH